MSNELISVIVPCYNLESYIRKCLDSILRQTYENLEVIVIDDGSTDKTPEILREYAASDARVVFISQSNAGAGEAANKGIEFSHGKFIAFVDNDDWLEPKMYEKLYTALKSNNADMSVCNFNLVYEEHTDFCYSNTNIRNESACIYDDVYGYFCRYCACPKPNNYMWSRLYRAEIVKESGVRFENFRMGADTLFNFKLLPLINRVSFIKEGLYNYVQRKDSSVYTAAIKSNISEVYADGFESLADYYMANGHSEFLKILPLHASTRIRSIFFYSRLAGLNDEKITEDVKSAFKGRKIEDYLPRVVK